MIEKMKFLSITGPKADIDRVVDTYLSRYEIHLENALSELKTVKDLRPYIETNPYKEELLKAQAMMESYHELLPGGSERRVSLETALETVRSLDRKLSELTEQKNELLSQRAALQDSMDKVVPFSGLNYDVRRILGFQYIKFRFGRISREYYEKFSAYVYDTIDTILFKCKEDDQYIWIVYFVPESWRTRSTRSTLPCILSACSCRTSTMERPPRRATIWRIRSGSWRQRSCRWIRISWLPSTAARTT